MILIFGRPFEQMLSSRDGRPFGHSRHGPKRERGCCAPFGEAASPSSTIWPGPRSASVPSGILICPAAWPQQVWTENWGPAVPLLGGAGSPFNSMWPGPWFTSVPSGILIHVAVWQQ